MKKRTVIIDVSPTSRTIRGTSAACCNYRAHIFLLLLILVVGCEREVVPQYLMGVWKTSAPQYADRYLKISEHTILFGIGDGQEVSHTIDKINKKQDDGKIVYTFYYRDAEGEKETLTVIYRPDSGGTLQMKNSENIWEKSKSGDNG
jgi:hypothetical protein